MSPYVPVIAASLFWVGLVIFAVGLAAVVFQKVKSVGYGLAILGVVMIVGGVAAPLFLIANAQAETACLDDLACQIGQELENAPVTN